MKLYSLHLINPLQGLNWESQPYACSHNNRKLRKKNEIARTCTSPGRRMYAHHCSCLQLMTQILTSIIEKKSFFFTLSSIVLKLQRINSFTEYLVHKFFPWFLQSIWSALSTLSITTWTLSSFINIACRSLAHLTVTLKKGRSREKVQSLQTSKILEAIHIIFNAKDPSKSPKNTVKFQILQVAHVKPYDFDLNTPTWYHSSNNISFINP